MSAVSGSVLQPSLKRAYSIREICDSLGVSKGVIRKEIKLGRLLAKRIGRRRLVVTPESLSDYMERATT
jgi:excisionase family DNA binding protein